MCENVLSLSCYKQILCISEEPHNFEIKTLHYFDSLKFSMYVQNIAEFHISGQILNNKVLLVIRNLQNV